MYRLVFFFFFLTQFRFVKFVGFSVTQLFYLKNELSYIMGSIKTLKHLNAVEILGRRY